jgi:CelD/BcsL family acetyltransferase involved in cellulose biosynthesis
LARAALALPEQDLLLITDLERRSVFARALECDARHLGVAGAIEPAQTISYATLPATWALFVAQLRANRRSKLRKQRARLAEQGARFFVWEAAAELDRAVDRLTTLHRMRWAASGASASFSSRQYVEFHRMIIKACFPRGWLRLYCLEIAGEIVGITYCYRFRNRIYLMQAGFDPAWAKLNPGAVLLGYALEHAIGEGNEVFDFLRGRHRYKDELATGTRETVSARYWRPTLGALAYRARHIWLPHWKAQIRSGKSQSLTLKSPTHRVVKNVENPVMSSPAIFTPGANTTFLKKQPGTPPARPAIFCSARA